MYRYDLYIVENRLKEGVRGFLHKSRWFVVSGRRTGVVIE